MNEKAFSLWKDEKQYIRIYNHGRVDKVYSIYLRMVMHIWVDSTNFHGTRWLQPKKYSWSNPNQKQVPRSLYIWENNQIGHFSLYMYLLPFHTYSAFNAGADFNQWFYSSLGHRDFSISSWILLHKVFFVHWKAVELAPREPIEFIKPVSTKLCWLSYENKWEPGNLWSFMTQNP